MSKKISVLMSTYNEPLEWIQKSIDSILNQSYSNFEYIIVCDNPLRIELLNFLKNLKDPRIKVIYNKKNLGLAKSLNLAFEHSSGTYIARMDADDIAYIDRFEKQLELMESNQGLDFISGNVDIIDERDHIIQKAQGVEYKNNDLKEILTIANVFVHPTFFLKREIFIKIGGYREFPASEDYDFVLRALSLKINMLHSNQTLLMYRMRRNSMTLGNSLISQICAVYIRKLYRERTVKEEDSFSQSELINLTSVSQEEKELYSRIMFNIRVRYRGNKKRIAIHILKGLIISKYFRQNFFDLVYVKYILKKKIS